MTERPSALLCYLRALLCVKETFQTHQQDSERCHKQLLKILFIPIQRYATYFSFFFKYCAFCFFFQVCSCLYFPVMGILLPPLFFFVFVFFSLSLHVCCFLILRVSFHPSLHFSCAGMRMQRKTGTGDNRTESRTRDRNGTRVFRSTEVLSGNRCWKNRKKTHIFVIKRKNTSDFSV